MNGRFAKILLCILSGALLLIAGCMSPAPTGGAGPAPTQGGPATGQAVTGTDLGAVTSLLQSIDERLSTVVENTRPEGKGTVTDNLVLFDTSSNDNKPITTGASIVALPVGKCDVAIYAQSARLYVTLEEEKDLRTGGADQRYYRNRQTCIDEIMCRRTIQLDDDFAFLYIEYKPYTSSGTLNQVTLSYRCK
jgi:hypothetical protein